MPRSTAAVAIKLPIAAMSSVPFHHDDADVARLRLVDHLDRVLRGERRRRLVGGRGPGQRRHGAAHHIRAGHQLHVIAHRPVLAGDELDRVGHRRRIAALEPGDQRVARRVGALRAARSTANRGGGAQNGSSESRANEYERRMSHTSGLLEGAR